MQTFVDTEYCVSEPDHYRLCSKTVCVPISETCPCPHGEMQCSDGQCLPYHLICHTDKRCRETDKEYCSTDIGQSLPASAVAVILTASIVVCVLLSLLLYYLYLRRQRNNTSRESQTALDPLQNEKTDELNYASIVNRNFKTRHKNSTEQNSVMEGLSQNICSRSYYHWNQFVNRISCFDTDSGCPECEHSTDSCVVSSSEQFNASETHEANDPIYKRTISSPDSPLINNKGLTTYANQSPKNSNPNVCAKDESPVKLGKYIYRPRSRKPPVIYHSYVPSHTEPSTPTSVDFDRDKIPFLFPQEFLCASTPKQTVKQLVFPAGQDIEFMDEYKYDDKA